MNYSFSGHACATGTFLSIYIVLPWYSFTQSGSQEYDDNCYPACYWLNDPNLCRCISLPVSRQVVGMDETPKRKVSESGVKGIGRSAVNPANGIGRFQNAVSQMHPLRQLRFIVPSRQIIRRSHRRYCWCQPWPYETVNWRNMSFSLTSHKQSI